MGPILHGLMKLQRVENRLRAVQSRLTRNRRSIIFQENQLRTLQSELESKKEEIKLTRIQADRLELELKDRDAHITKLRAVLNTARTNKEYSAILSELNTTKADDTKIENQVLELMRNIETDETACLGIQNQIEEQKGKLAEQRGEYEVRAAECQAQIDEIQREWDSAAHQIPSDMLEIFKRVAETYDGEAMAVAGKQDENIEAYSCGGCFMGLPIEVVNRLMTKDEIIRCSSCTRILVLRTPEGIGRE